MSNGTLKTEKRTVRLSTFFDKITASAETQNKKRYRSDSSANSTPAKKQKFNSHNDSGSDLTKFTVVNNNNKTDEVSIDNKTIANKKDEPLHKDESGGSEMVLSVGRKSMKKKSIENAAEEAALREKQIKLFRSFAKVSLQYSEFLEKKISTATQNRMNGEDEEACDRQKLVESLKYFTGRLHPYQVEGVTWFTILYENSLNGILADDMGLGKTIQIIAFICYLYELNVNGPYLIVVPLTTLANWESEFKKFAPKIPVVRFHGDMYERHEQKKYISTGNFYIDDKRVKPVIICNYEVVHNEFTFLERYHWEYVVADEGHKLKNPDAKISRELRALDSKSRTLLTGTPIQNNIRELWSLFNYVLPDLFRNVQGFSSILELEDVKNTGKLLADEARTNVITTIHQVLSSFMLRRTKNEVLTNLVPKKEVIIYCSMTKWQEYLYRAALNSDADKLRMLAPKEQELNKKRSCRRGEINYNQEWFSSPKSTVKERRSAVVEYSSVPKELGIPKCSYFCDVSLNNIMMLLQKIVSHPYLLWCPLDPNDKKNNSIYISNNLIQSSGKLRLLDALLPKLRTQGHKVLIFSNFVMMLNMIEEMLIMREYNYRRIDGSVNYETRKTSIDDFKNDPNVFIFLLSTKASGLGLNLTEADTVIFVDRDWNPMNDLQAQDRCYRIGQTKPVVIYSLVAKGTIDDIILNRGNMKKRLKNIILQDGEHSSKRKLDGDLLRNLEKLLHSEEESLKVRPDGLFYTKKELDQILDRSDLFEEMEKRKVEMMETSKST